MTNKASPGQKLRQAVEQNNPLQVVGAVNAYNAIMAEKCGHKALYLSGGGVAACSLGTPDLGISTLHDVLEDARRITDASALPLLVDIDTGWGGAFNISRCIREMIRTNVAGVHIEDQVMQKRCGHRPNKAIVSQRQRGCRAKKFCHEGHRFLPVLFYGHPERGRPPIAGRSLADHPRLGRSRDTGSIAISAA